MFAQMNMADKSKIHSLLDSGLVPTNYILVLSGTLSECACLNQLPAAGNRIDKSPETNCAFTCCQNNQDIFFVTGNIFVNASSRQNNKITVHKFLSWCHVNLKDAIWMQTLGWL